MRPHYFMANRRGKCGRSDRFLLLGLQNHCGLWLQPSNQKTIASWGKVMTNLNSVEKQRHYSAHKDPNSQGYGLPCGHVQLWKLGRKEDRTPKIWCFWTLVLERTPESPLDNKEIKPVNFKGDQPWIFTGRTDAETEALIFCSSDVNRQLIGKVPDAGKDGGQKEKRILEDEMAAWHHWRNEYELGQTLGDGEGQGGLVCCSPWLKRVGHNWVTEQELGILYTSERLIEKQVGEFTHEMIEHIGQILDSLEKTTNHCWYRWDALAVLPSLVFAMSLIMDGDLQGRGHTPWVAGSMSLL